MAKPNKKRGFRKLTIKDINFNWCFLGKIDIRPDENRNNQLIIDFGWYDIWLHVEDLKNPPSPYDPKVITPQFVKKCILFAIANGWDIEKKVDKFELLYRQGTFTLKVANEE